MEYCSTPTQPLLVCTRQKLKEGRNGVLFDTNTTPTSLHKTEAEGGLSSPHSTTGASLQPRTHQCHSETAVSSSSSPHNAIGVVTPRLPPSPGPLPNSPPPSPLPLLPHSPPWLRQSQQQQQQQEGHVQAGSFPQQQRQPWGTWLETLQRLQQLLPQTLLLLLLLLLHLGRMEGVGVRSPALTLLGCPPGKWFMPRPSVKRGVQSTDSFMGAMLPQEVLNVAPQVFGGGGRTAAAAPSAHSTAPSCLNPPRKYTTESSQTVKPRASQL
jgi:hypothetical protein